MKEEQRDLSPGKGHNVTCPECKYRVFVMPGQPEAVA